jgi:hypothetical protein
MEFLEEAYVVDVQVKRAAPNERHTCLQESKVISIGNQQTQFDELKCAHPYIFRKTRGHANTSIHYDISESSGDAHLSSVKKRSSNEPTVAWTYPPSFGTTGCRDASFAK